MTPRDKFTSEVNQLDRDINLAKAALYIAQLEYPDLDIDKYLNTLEAIAKEIATKLPKTRIYMTNCTSMETKKIIMTPATAF
jgi:regulator of sirC expression with transglutaminase-like and TPR domain